MKNNNPFEFFQSFMNQENISKSMKWMPNMNFLHDTFKESLETINSTTQLVSESLQSVAKRNADSFQKNTSELFNTMKAAVAAGDVEQINSCQQHYIKSSIENNINNTKEVLDITSKSSREILEVIGKNCSESLNRSFNKKEK